MSERIRNIKSAPCFIATKAPAVANYNAERDQLLSTLKSGVQGQALAGLKKKAEVMDNRRFLKAGIRR